MMHNVQPRYRLQKYTAMWKMHVQIGLGNNKVLKRVNISRFHMLLPHCVVFFNYLPCFVDVYGKKVIILKTQHNAENACENGMWQQLGLKKKRNKFKEFRSIKFLPTLTRQSWQRRKLKFFFGSNSNFLNWILLVFSGSFLDDKWLSFISILISIFSVFGLLQICIDKKNTIHYTLWQKSNPRNNY